MTITWKQVLNEHNWSAELGDIYRLIIGPDIAALGQGIIRYHAQVCSVNMAVLADEADLPDVETAKRRAIFLCWRHNNRVADALLEAVQ